MTDWLATDNLQHPVDRHMRTDFVLLRPEQTVAEALDTILERQPSERIIYFYVADSDDRLQGVVPTRRLLLSPRDKPLSQIMIKPVIAIPRNATVLDACEFFILHRLLAFPVVDQKHRIVGLVDVELYTQELSDLDRSETHRDLFQLIGIQLSEAQQRNVPNLFRRRLPWLLATLVGGMLAAAISDYYYDVASLAFVLPFIPLVLALAGSVAAQSVSLAIQALHGQQPTWNVLLPRFRIELATGSLLGLTCGAIAAAGVLAWTQDLSAALSLLAGVAAGVMCAALLGLMVPFVLRIFSRRPHVAAGPVALLLTDAVALVVYFNLSRWLLELRPPTV